MNQIHGAIDIGKSLGDEGERDLVLERRTADNDRDRDRILIRRSGDSVRECVTERDLNRICFSAQGAVAFGAVSTSSGNPAAVELTFEALVLFLPTLGGGGGIVIVTS